MHGARARGGFTYICQFIFGLWFGLFLLNPCIATQLGNSIRFSNFRKNLKEILQPGEITGLIQFDIAFTNYIAGPANERGFRANPIQGHMLRGKVNLPCMRILTCNPSFLWKSHASSYGKNILDRAEQPQEENRRKVCPTAGRAHREQGLRGTLATAA